MLVGSQSRARRRAAAIRSRCRRRFSAEPVAPAAARARVEAPATTESVRSARGRRPGPICRRRSRCACWCASPRAQARLGIDALVTSGPDRRPRAVFVHAFAATVPAAIMRTRALRPAPRRPRRLRLVPAARSRSPRPPGARRGVAPAPRARSVFRRLASTSRCRAIASCPPAAAPAATAFAASILGWRRSRTATAWRAAPPHPPPKGAKATTSSPRWCFSRSFFALYFSRSDWPVGCARLRAASIVRRDHFPALGPVGLVAVAAGHPTARAAAPAAGAAAPPQVERYTYVLRAA